MRKMRETYRPDSSSKVSPGLQDRMQNEMGGGNEAQRNSDVSHIQENVSRLPEAKAHTLRLILDKMLQ